MIPKRNFACFAGLVVCLLLLAASCAPPDKEPDITRAEPAEPVTQPPVPGAVTLALKFAAQDSANYRLITERNRRVDFEGALSGDAAFKGGETGDKVEMTFGQQIQSVDDKGNAVAKITITALKYLAKEKDVLRLDFDSLRAEDRNSPFARLIGHSYTIEITPSGEVIRVIDAEQARAAVGSGTPASERALVLLESDAIKERHTVAALPPADKSSLRTKDDWSKIKTFDFGLLGAKAYERIYLLKEVKKVRGRNIAVVEMNAIPTTDVAEQMQGEQLPNAFAKMFDSRDIYTGRLRLDLTAGKVDSYFEKMLSEWVVVDPLAKGPVDQEPATLRMMATQLYSLERID